MAALARDPARLIVLKWHIAALRFAAALFRCAIAERKAGFNPNQPRVPRGNPDGGEWTSEGGGLSQTRPGRSSVDEVSAARRNSRAPKISQFRPPTAQERNAVIKVVAAWLAENALGAGEFIARTSWLYDALPYINAYLDAPKSLAELYELAATPAPGYDIHHVVEKTSAAQDGFPRKLIDRDDNLVRIPRLKHWQINGWFQSPHPDYNHMSPREYLRGKDWDTRRQVGLRALVEFGVLKP